MTPIDHVQSLEPDARLNDVIGMSEALHFSRLPLRDGTDTPMERYVLKDDILEHALRGDTRTRLDAIARTLAHVPDDTSLPDLFDLMVDRREHLAVAHGADGDATGIVTMEDVIETLLGMEIYDEVDDEERLHERARAHWLERARRLGRLTGLDERQATLGITGGEPPALSHGDAPRGAQG